MSQAEQRTDSPVMTNPRPTEVHRVGAVVFALVIGVFGILGFLGGLPYFSTRGDMVAGMSSNGLLSTLSVATAAVLIIAAMRGGRFASSVMVVVGAAFILSGLINLALIDTSFNMLAFRTSNVFFSIGAGLVLLLLGAYGRVSGNLPRDNPYYVDAHGADAEGDDAEEEPPPPTDVELAADAAMAHTERVVAGAVFGVTPTDEQRRRVAAMSRVRTHEERRRVWLGFDAGPS